MGKIVRIIASLALLGTLSFAAAAQDPTEESCKIAYEQALEGINKPAPKNPVTSFGPSAPFVMEGVRGPIIKRKAQEAAAEDYRECLFSVPLPPNADGTCPAGSFPVEVTPPQNFVNLDAVDVRDLKTIRALQASPLNTTVTLDALKNSKVVEAAPVKPNLELKAAVPTEKIAPAKPALREQSKKLETRNRVTARPAPDKTKPATKLDAQISVRDIARLKQTDRSITVRDLDTSQLNRLKVSPALMKSSNQLKVENFKFEKIEIDQVKTRLDEGAKIKCLKSESNLNMLFIIVKLPKLYAPGQKIKVAFNGGSPGIRTAVYSVAQHWAHHTADPVTGERLFDFDFGTFGPYGVINFHEWSTEDEDYAAHIRISFNPNDGYWSFIGTDSGNPEYVLPGEPSMNLAGMDNADALPPDWQKTIFHEFGHALGLEHEHQHPTSVCGDALRLEDDDGYTLALDAWGTAIEDSEGRRPGVLTYLEHYPNYWSREDAVFNLAQLQEDDTRFTTAFDPASIMRYEFPIEWYKDIAPDECLPTGDLPSGPSSNDYAALRLAYGQQFCAPDDPCEQTGSSPMASPGPN